MRKRRTPCRCSRSRSASWSTNTGQMVLLQWNGPRALGDQASTLNPLENAVRRAADRVLDETRPSAEELRALREAFIPALVRINDAGEYVRHTAIVDTLPAASQPLLNSLAAARLLVMRRDEETRVVEVAHEALLRKWPLLRGWLDAEREFLIARKTLESDLGEWQRAPADRKSDALLSGIKLERASSWMADRPTQLSQDERALVADSIRRAEEEQQRRQKEHEFAQRQLTLQSGVVAGYARAEAEAGNYTNSVLLAFEGATDEYKGIIRHAWRSSTSSWNPRSTTCVSARFSRGRFRTMECCLLPPMVPAS